MNIHTPIFRGPIATLVGVVFAVSVLFAPTRAASSASAVHGTVAALLSAVQHNNNAAALTFLTAKNRHSIGKVPVMYILHLMSPPIRYQLHVDRVARSTATVTVHLSALSGSPVVDRLSLVTESGKWKISDVKWVK